MRLLTITLILFCFHSITFGQMLAGKVYDSISVVKNMKVHNKTQNRLTITDDDGNFSIEAKVNDTITFKSVFYHPKEVVLNQAHFDNVNVFEVKKITNELDAVEIKSEVEQPVFEEETYNTELHNLIKADMENNPHLYMPEKAYYGGNILAIIDLVAKLFKKKNKYKAPAYTPITYKQLDSLFENNNFFTKRLITEDLKIPEQSTHLFYDFCSAKGISSELLKEEKRMELLEQLVVNSQLFIILLEEYGKKTAVKD